MKLKIDPYFSQDKLLETDTPAILVRDTVEGPVALISFENKAENIDAAEQIQHSQVPIPEIDFLLKELKAGKKSFLSGTAIFGAITKQINILPAREPDTYWVLNAATTGPSNNPAYNDELNRKEALIRANAEIINIFLQYKNWHDALLKVFGLLGSSINVDRIYYFDFHKNKETGEDVTSQRFEWVKDDVEPMIDNPDLQDVPVELFTEFMTPLQKGLPFEAIIRELPESETKSTLQSQDILSILVLPLQLNNELLGFIGFDDCTQERKWSEDDLNFLRSASSNLATAMNRQNALLAMEQAYEEKENILQSIGEGFVSIGRDWNIRFWNKQAEELLKVENEVVLGKNVLDIFPNLKNTIIFNSLDRVLQTGLKESFEYYRQLDNSWYEADIYPTKDGASVIFKDISERKFASMQLEEMNVRLDLKARELSRVNTELERFAFVVSHDLQEPLRMITNFLDLISTKYGPVIDEKGKRYINFAMSGAGRMRSIILDVLEFYRIGKQTGQLQELAVHELINDVIFSLQLVIQETNAVIDVGSMPLIKGHKFQLIQLFQNLIGNAMKYHKPDVPPVVTLRSRELEDAWEFSVADNGIGIEPAYHDQIFVIFKRLHTRDIEGNGLGLALCKKLVEDMGGKIWVESEAGQGSTFKFVMPKR